MVLATLIGVPIGVTMLKNLPEDWIIGGLGCVLIVHSTRSLIQNASQRVPVGATWGYVAGGLGGLLGGGGSIRQGLLSWFTEPLAVGTNTPLSRDITSLLFAHRGSLRCRSIYNLGS